MLMQLTNSLERIYEILDEESDLEERKNAGEHTLKGEIVFKDVTFGYKSYLPVLEHLNFQIRPGEMIGLVGSSGAGKSTLINLLMRLYDVDDGQILADGVDLRDISRECLHRQIGVVLHETVSVHREPFTTTSGTPSRMPPKREVYQAAKMANAHDFISPIP